MATSASIERPVPRLASLPDGMLALAGLAATAGIIHLVASVEPVGADWELGLFFALVGGGQLYASWRITHAPEDRRTLVLGAAGSIVVALLWIVSRTTGMPVGPESGRVSAVGVADTIATVQELAFCALAVAVLRAGARAGAGIGSRVARALSGALGVRLTFAVLSLTLMMAALGGHEH